ncbi:MAG: CDP-glycerol glycerophosphotransferase family protein [Chlamydiales bacterium]
MACSSSIAILAGRRLSFLDHLVPLCHLMDMPLLCTDRWVFMAAEHFYPETKLILADEDNFEEIVSHYQTLYTVEPCRLHPFAFRFGEYLYRGEAQTVCGFHGNSDKYRTRYWIERYVDEDVVLFYGQHFIDFLIEKGVWSRVKKGVFIGNLRLQFYQRHKDFFDKIIQPHLFPKGEDKVILYAPTWSFLGSCDDSPFFEMLPSVLDQIPKGFRVMVKLHPYSFNFFPEKVAQIKERYNQHEQIFFLDEVPLVYPLLDHADIFLGDYSSVGYDFLAFNKPLFFLGDKKGALQKVGVVVEDFSKLYQILDRKDEYGQKRRTLYEYAYGPPRPFDNIREELNQV